MCKTSGCLCLQPFDLNGRFPTHKRKKKELLFHPTNGRWGETFLVVASSLLFVHFISSALALLSVD
jgi:hypothetical protein